MKKTIAPPLPEGSHEVKALTQVLKDSELVRGMVKESADELASVNSLLNEEFSDGDHPPGIGEALEKSEAVEIKVQEASDKLSVVNRRLEKEVHKRHLLEQELAATLEQHEEALHSSLHDALTGLPNRVLFNDRLEHGIEQAKRHGWTLAVMFLDLDKFKSINDLHGHAAGDAVLLTLAKRLTETTRTDDTISRYGGDERDAATVAKKIIQAVQAPCDVGGVALVVNTSIGIAIYPGDGATAEALIQSADAAMYKAKQSKSGYAYASNLRV